MNRAAGSRAAALRDAGVRAVGFRTARRTLPWLLLGVLILAQIGYPLTEGAARSRLTVATVLLGCLLSVGHAWLARGFRTVTVLVAAAAGGGFVVEAVGVTTGFPFGGYDYSGQLGPRLAGVPLIIPLAWTWMAWPAWLAAGRLTDGPLRRIVLGAVGLAAWDLFLDPQMVADGHWTWRDTTAALPGLPGIPVSNYLGWLGFALLVMTALRYTDPGPGEGGDAPMLALYLWTYAGSVLAHAVFLDLRASALWGGLGMGVVAVPLAIRLARPARAGPA